MNDKQIESEDTNAEQQTEQLTTAHSSTPSNETHGFDLAMLEEEQVRAEKKPAVQYKFLKNLKEQFYTKEFYNVVILGFIYMLVFVAFGPAQGFTTVIFPTTGFYALASLYFVFSISNFFAPAVQQILGVRFVLFGKSKNFLVE